MFIGYSLCGSVLAKAQPLVWSQGSVWSVERRAEASPPGRNHVRWMLLRSRKRQTFRMPTNKHALAISYILCVLMTKQLKPHCLSSCSIRLFPASSTLSIKGHLFAVIESCVRGKECNDPQEIGTHQFEFAAWGFSVVSYSSGLCLPRLLSIGHLKPCLVHMADRNMGWSTGETQSRTVTASRFSWITIWLGPWRGLH